mmetsp:Transcript_1676/g.3589  ORF Transcript_1676/g.3589 Transcript_1676/m.3589 type:complete len:258 (-) Transcript_1676:1367-2140(-)|eukprot:CAMPEP_0204906344 /NCGR_PEP_ID=MMETSP1397-20131031/5924_1 /ASSEMBLY_ACC=CAM_ASM_000891 /TAXON_ID=49980 /ORGANISM="Climacostomum Climacostomum virens, Strain Stock W-24" /LENGTH=257 /DNA_ID=CAMNT_0052075333 /DNA_START=142 /DNA_END=915 /DNA_ORIENTATION=-
MVLALLIMSKALNILRLPWKFGGITPKRSEKIPHTLQNDLLELQPGFEKAYNGMAKSIAEGNRAYLESTMEPLLYKTTCAALDSLAETKQKLVLLNPDSPCKLSFLNERLYVNMAIPRSDATTHDFQSLAEFMESNNKAGKEGRVQPDHVFQFLDQHDKFGVNVLKVDVLFQTKTKLVLLDAEALPEANDQEEQHLLRFETELNYANSARRMSKVMIDVWDFVYGSYSDWLNRCNWFISDADDLLEGNPYCNYGKDL